jgi:hypothetical protein
MKACFGGFGQEMKGEKAMRSKYSLVLLALAMAWIPAGCATAHSEKAIAESIELQIIPTRVASVSEARVVQMGADTVVSGTVRKFHEFFLPGHVDIVICDPQGTVIARVTPRLTGHASKRGGVKEGRFSAEVRLVPPPGSKVCVRYHAPASGEEHLECTLKRDTPRRSHRLTTIAC